MRTTFRIGIALVFTCLSAPLESQAWHHGYWGPGWGSTWGPGWGPGWGPAWGRGPGVAVTIPLTGPTVVTSPVAVVPSPEAMNLSCPDAQTACTNRYQVCLQHAPAAHCANALQYCFSTVAPGCGGTPVPLTTIGAPLPTVMIAP